MKTRRKTLLTLTLTLLLTLPMISASTSLAYAGDNTSKGDAGLAVKLKLEDVWYKFETPLITLIFPAGGRKPMFIWWYTNDTEELYVVKFKGVIEYLVFDKPYYIRRSHANAPTINETIWKAQVEPKIMHPQGKAGKEARLGFMRLLPDLHTAFLPFSACRWTLEGPEPMANGWTFNFTLAEVPMPKFIFAENNIKIKCRFYNTTVTEIPDEENPDYNYTVAAGQLKFDFVVNKWEWNIDKLQAFLEWLNEILGIKTSVNETGLALWINIASIKMEDLTHVQNEVEGQLENQVEAKSQAKGVTIGSEYYPVDQNETAANQDEKPLQLKEQLREPLKIRFAHEEETLAGFFDFVPWARLLDESGDTVDYVDVTASYIAAGGHLRLFLCYPYFNGYTLEHDPSIGLDLAPQIPTLITPELIGILLIATVATTLAILIYKKRKGIINIVSP